MNRFFNIKRIWGKAFLTLLVTSLTAACATTGGGDGPKGTRGYLGSMVEWKEINVYDPENLLVPFQEYEFVHMFDSGWKHEVTLIDGKMNLLLGIPPESSMQHFKGHVEGTILKVTPPDLEVFETSFFYKDEEKGLYIGYESQYSRGKPNFKFSYLYYADRDAAIKGTTTFRGRASSATVKYNLSFKRGWNMVVRTVNGSTTSYKVDVPDRSFKWIARKY
jgi:hypothetical protein